MTHSIAVDFGGTNIRSAYYPSAEPTPQEQIKIPTLADTGPEKVIERLIDGIEQVMPPDREGIRVGIASPGPLDPKEGVIFKAPNLKGWTDIPLRSQLESRLNCPVYLVNDANAAALGEWKYGAGQGSTDLVYLTLSTGIGGGVIVNKQLLLGARGLAGEIGHITMQPGGPECGCGVRGHIEALASGPAMARSAMEQLRMGRESSLREVFEDGGKITAVELGEHARQGDELALGVIKDAGTLIGHLLADLAHIFNPQIFVLGGGVSQLGDILFAPIRYSFSAHLMDPVYGEGVQIVPAALGDDAGLVGALVIANQR